MQSLRIESYNGQSGERRCCCENTAMPPRHSPETIDTALAALISAGNAATASRHLEMIEGLKINERTIARWREQHSDRYDEILKGWQKQRDERVIRRLDHTTLLATEVQQRALEQALKEAKAGELRDPAGAAQKASVTLGITVEKAQLLKGLPTEITARATPDELLAKLTRALGPGTLERPELTAGD